MKIWVKYRKYHQLPRFLARMKRTSTAAWYARYALIIAGNLGDAALQKVHSPRHTYKVSPGNSVVIEPGQPECFEQSIIVSPAGEYAWLVKAMFSTLCFDCAWLHDPHPIKDMDSWTEFLLDAWSGSRGFRNHLTVSPRFMRGLRLPPIVARLVPMLC